MCANCQSNSFYDESNSKRVILTITYSFTKSTIYQVFLMCQTQAVFSPELLDLLMPAPLRQHEPRGDRHLCDPNRAEEAARHGQESAFVSPRSAGLIKKEGNCLRPRRREKLGTLPTFAGGNCEAGCSRRRK